MINDVTEKTQVSVALVEGPMATCSCGCSCYCKCQCTPTEVSSERDFDAWDHWDFWAYRLAYEEAYN